MIMLYKYANSLDLYQNTYISGNTGLIKYFFDINLYGHVIQHPILVPEV